MGGSAGGNLVTSLMVKLIESKIKKVDLVVLIYPCLSMKEKRYTPSYNISLDDKMISHSLMLKILKAYRDDAEEDNVYLSPLFME